MRQKDDAVIIDVLGECQSRGIDTNRRSIATLIDMLGYHERKEFRIDNKYIRFVPDTVIALEGLKIWEIKTDERRCESILLFHWAEVKWRLMRSPEYIRGMASRRRAEAGKEAQRKPPKHLQIPNRGMKMEFILVDDLGGS